MYTMIWIKNKDISVFFRNKYLIAYLGVCSLESSFFVKFVHKTGEVFVCNIIIYVFNIIDILPTGFKIKTPNGIILTQLS